MKHENKTAWKQKTPKHVRRIVHPYSGSMSVHSGAWVIAALMWPYHVTKEQEGRIIIDSTICRQICWNWCWDAYKFEAVISWNQNNIIVIDTNTTGQELAYVIQSNKPTHRRFGQFVLHNCWTSNLIIGRTFIQSEKGIVTVQNQQHTNNDQESLSKLASNLLGCTLWGWGTW